MRKRIDDGRQVVLVECYVSAPDEAALRAAATRATAASAALTSAGTSVEYLGALLVAADEAAFHLFMSPDIDAVIEASRQAGLRVERVSQALAVWIGTGGVSRAQAISVGGEVEGAIGHPPRQLGP
ncbi:MAG TPA: hypothetical protein VFQ81_01705 [Candidatus Limnocylindria bacterium]|nr:hypothetical protein [Candidatus Limnocylindria bacterium]